MKFPIANRERVGWSFIWYYSEGELAIKETKLWGKNTVSVSVSLSLLMLLLLGFVVTVTGENYCRCVCVCGERSLEGDCIYMLAVIFVDQTPQINFLSFCYCFPKIWFKKISVCGVMCGVIGRESQLLLENRICGEVATWRNGKKNTKVMSIYPKDSYCIGNTLLFLLKGCLSVSVSPKDDSSFSCRYCRRPFPFH